MSPVSRSAPADITTSRLQLFAPRCDYLHVAPTLDSAAKAHGILTPREVRHWLAQLHHESEGFTVLEEDLHYTRQGLLETWPTHFTPAEALQCAGDPRAIACRAYAGRDGNTLPLDGWTYRGRGWIQLTGRATYAAAGRRLGQPYEAQPQLVATPEHAALTAADYWSAHKLDQVVAEHVDDLSAANAVRRVINGGLLGLDDVERLLRLAATIWRD